MNLKQLRQFLVVAQEHQITSAAKLLYTSQPPLSYNMKQLEKELGTKLFIRESHGIELTDAGKVFQRYAKQMVSLTDNVKEEVQREQAGTMGTIKLGLISSAGKLIDPAILQSFRQYYPAVTFELTEANTFELIKQVNSGLIDLALVRTPYNALGIDKKTIANDPIVAVFDQHYYHLPAGSLDLSAFSQRPLILYRRFEAMLNNGFAQAGIAPFYAVKCDDARTAVLWADQGMGVAIVPRSIAELYGHHSVQVIDYPRWATKVQVVWQKGAQLSPISQKLIDAL